MDTDDLDARCGVVGIVTNLCPGARFITENEQGARVVIPRPGGGQHAALMQFGQALPVRGARRQAPRIIGKGQLDTDQSGDRSRYPLMTGPCVIDKAAVLAAGTYPATWVATTPSRALIVSAQTFWTLLRQQPPVREHVLRYLARQVGQSRDALAACAAGTAASRIARWLLAARTSGATPTVCLPAGQQGLAEELGLSRVTVNRALQQLVRAGIVSVRPRAIVILDPAKLACATDWQPGRAARGTPT